MLGSLQYATQFRHGLILYEYELHGDDGQPPTRPTHNNNNNNNNNTAAVNRLITHCC